MDLTMASSSVIGQPPVNFGRFNILSFLHLGRFEFLVCLSPCNVYDQINSILPLSDFIRAHDQQQKKKCSIVLCDSYGYLHFDRIWLKTIVFFRFKGVRNDLIWVSCRNVSIYRAKFDLIRCSYWNDLNSIHFIVSSYETRSTNSFIIYSNIKRL